MENCLVKDEIFTTKINNETALHYEKNIADKKLYIDPLFNKWLTEQKEKKGKNGLLCHSSKDKLYFYFESINDENDIKKMGYSFFYICEYCRSIYHYDSYCCNKNGLIKELRRYLFYTEHSGKIDDMLWLRAFPFVFRYLFCLSMILGLYGHRKVIYENSIYYGYDVRGYCFTTTFLLIMVPFIILYSFVYYFPYIILHLIYVVLLYRKIKRDKNNNNI